MVTSAVYKPCNPHFVTKSFSGINTMGNPMDPLTLLKALSALLDHNGGVNEKEDMVHIMKLMKDAEQLVSRCVYLNILRVTESTELLEKFLTVGGWTLMNSWLSDAKKTDNMPLVLEIIKLLQRLPLKIDHLKQNNTPKIIKSFAKSASCPKIKSTSGSLMNNWLSIIRDSSGNQTATTTSEAMKKKKEKLKIQRAKVDKAAKKEPSKNTSKPPPVSRAPSFTKFRKTGLETDQEMPKKAGKRSSIDSEDSNVPDKKIKQESKHPKKITMSGGFMDALNSVPVIPIKRTVKRKPAPSSKTKTSSSSPVHKTSPVHDPLAGEAADFGALMEARSKSPSPVPVDTEPKKPKLDKYGRPQKSVRWATEELLQSVRYFEVEEGERVNVATQNFKDALVRERLQERETLGDFHHKGESSWKKPTPIDLPAPLVEFGANSVEKDIQTEREKTVLQSIFLTIEMVPDSPMEPDPEPYDMIPPKIIPIDDPNDPGPPAISPVPEKDPLKASPNGFGGDKKGKDDITDKLREIIQNATGKKPDPHTAAPTTPPPDAYLQPPPQQQMPPNGVDPNVMFMVPPGGNGYFPHGGPMMMPPPGMMPPNEQYPMDWNMPPPNMQPPPMERNGGPRSHFPPMYGRNDNWRPRGPWRGPRHESRGRWNHPRAPYRR